jgi:hypothetical protein
MEANQDIAPSPFAEVEPFTGEAESYPVGTGNPPVPLMRSQTQFHTAVAVQRPRNLDKVVAAVLREAEFAGDAFYYSFPMGGKKIEGPSIGLAMAVAREWSNCAVPVEYYETATEWVFNAHFVDLERGFTVSRVFRKKKGKGVFKKLEDDRAEDMTFQAAQSRAIRNVVLAGVPRWLTDQAKERAKDAVLRGISKEGLAVATDKALKFLAGYGITEERVLAVLGKPKHEWASEDIASLRGMASQLKDGQATAERLFPASEAQEERPKAATSKAETKPKRTRVPKAEAPVTPSSPASLLPRAATPEDLEAIRVGCLDKGIDIDLILQKWQVSRLEELDGASGQQVQEWLKGQ